MKIIALIPARSGSKGIPKKNIKNLNGKPLISYTIEAAKKAKHLNKEDIICSTDSKEIAEIANQYGARTPFLRPEKYATDEATSISVAVHALNWMKQNENKNYDYLMLLQPTSPLRKAVHIDEAIEKMKVYKTSSVVSVNKPDDMPYNMKKLNKEGELIDLIENDYTRRQDMPEIFATNGAIYLTKTDVILKEKSFFGDHSIPYIMNRKYSIDIDEMFDFKIVELFDELINDF